MTRWLRWLPVGFCLFAFAASAQTAQPILQPYQHFVDGSGNPCAGCKLFSYAAGTTTPQATYTDASESTQNPNPIVLNASGAASIWIGSSAYKFALLDTSGTTLWTVDQVLAPFPGGQGPFLPLAGGTMSGAIAMGGNNLLNAGTIAGTTINGGTGTFSGVLTAQANLNAQSNVIVGSEGTDNYLEILPAISGGAIFYLDNDANTLRIGNGAPGNEPLGYSVNGNLYVPNAVVATTVDAALNGSLGSTTPSTVAGTTGTFSGGLTGAGINGTSVTDSGLTSGNCVQASTGGLLATTSSPCDMTEIGSGSGCAFSSDGNGLTCTTTVTLATAMPDTDYDVSCSPHFSAAVATTTSAMPALGLGWSVTSKTSITVYEALNNGSSTGYGISSSYGVTIYCVAHHS